jgi:hypothetical protein
MNQTSDQDHRPTKWRRWMAVVVGGAILLVAVGASLLVAARVWLPDFGDGGWPGVPDPEQVVSMRARLFNFPRGEKGPPPFEVPREHIPAILKALHPYQKPAWTAGWQVLGNLYLKLQGGGRFVIQLYWTGGGPGAFSSGPTIRRPGYYRGGTDKGIEDAIRAAYHP